MKKGVAKFPQEVFLPEHETPFSIDFIALPNYHVCPGEEKNFYSVPYRYAGCKAEVIYNSKTVGIYIDHQRIAIHQRLFSRGNYRYQTQEDHMPQSHREWKEAQGCNGEYFLTEADKTGPAAHWAIQHILLGKIHEAHTYNSCKGVLSLAKKYTNERIGKAAQRCQAVHSVSYPMLKRILALKPDQAPPPPGQLSIPFHENLRGADHYQ